MKWQCINQNAFENNDEEWIVHFVIHQIDSCAFSNRLLRLLCMEICE